MSADGPYSSIYGTSRFAHFIFLILVVQPPSPIMAFTSITTRSLRQGRHIMHDARSGFSKHPHESLSSTAEVSSQPRLSVKEFQSSLQNQLILAPLTRGGNLPFRRLCADFNSNFTMSEMAYARNLFKGYHKAQKKERALAKKGPTEKYFGFQIATKSSDEALRAAELAVIEGATWIDLNCGCPIYEATRRGLGAAMLKRPSSLEKLVGLTVASTPLPMTVKIRLGVSDSKINAHEVVEGLVNAGVAAVTVHGRTMEQRYTRPADWNIISDIARKAGVPIIGNGDILTWYEAEDRMLESNNGAPHHIDDVTGLRSGVTAMMAGRGALIKPWIFKEWAEKKSWYPTAEERIAIYWELSVHFKDHFGSDDHGKRHTFYFLPWHFEFFCRYRPLPEEHFRDLSRQVPLIQNSRSIDDTLIKVGLLSGRGEPVEHRNKLLDMPLERLLRCEASECHLAIAEALWASDSAEEAVDALLLMSHSRLMEFELLQGSASKQSVRGRGPARDNEQGGSRSSRSDESSWEMGGAGPRGTRTASVDGEGEDGGESEGEGDEEGLGEGEGSAERDVMDKSTDSAPSNLEGSSDSNRDSGRSASRLTRPVGSNPRGRAVGRTSSGITLSELALPLLELRVGKVVSVGPHPDPTALNLVVTVVDLGSSDGIMRTAVTAQRMIAGNSSGMDGLIGRNMVVLCNLKERAFFGVASSVMLLFSTDETDKFSPVYAPSEVPLGSMISFPGYAAKPTDSVNKASKAWKQIERDASFHVNDEGIACFDPRPAGSRGRVGKEGDSQSKGDNAEVVGEGEGKAQSSEVVKKDRIVPFSIYLRDATKDSKDPASRVLCTATVIGRVL